MSQLAIMIKLHQDIEKIFKEAAPKIDYQSSDHCRECNGDGKDPDDGLQCMECERLLVLEAKADT